MTLNHRTGATAAAATLLAMLGLAVPPAASADDVLAEVIAGDWRPDAHRARDDERNPQASLEFWGLAPGMDILELAPGAGWWTHILAPYADRTGGRYFATAADLDDPELDDRWRQGRAAFERRFVEQPEIYGDVELINFGARSAPLPEAAFDFILTARAVHGWIRWGLDDKVVEELSAALRPGGILALKQHRAAPGPADPERFAETGYVTEAWVIERFEAAGLELVERSEINANPDDTRDHPFGVWTLPPTRASSMYGTGDPPDPDFDHAPYDELGESDRMTLKFRRPR